MTPTVLTIPRYPQPGQLAPREIARLIARDLDVPLDWTHDIHVDATDHFIQVTLRNHDGSDVDPKAVDAVCRFYLDDHGIRYEVRGGAA
jgi:hypothetical protein